MSVKLEDHAAVLAKVKANPEQFAVAREGIAAAKAGKSIADCPNDANPLMAQIWRIGFASVTCAPLTAEEAQKARAVMAAPLAIIDIPAGYPNEAALVAFLRTKGYDANVCDSARVLWNGAVVGWNVELSGKFTALFNEFNAKVAGNTDITKADSPLICEYSGCDECIIYSDGGVYASGREWTEGDKAAFIAWRSERSKQDGHTAIKLDGKAWSWSRDSSATRLQQRGVPEHIALAAITLAVLGGKAIVFGADGATITVERG